MKYLHRGGAFAPGSKRRRLIWEILYDAQEAKPMLSLTGILTGLALFILLAFRGHNLALSAIGCSCVMMAMSGIPLPEGLTQLYMPGMAGFVQNYFLLFLLSTVMGRLMSDAGAAKRIALSLARAMRRCGGDQKFFSALLVPVLYFVLCYVGISGFVVVFTVVPIARDLFEETDTPWRLYCCAGAQTMGAGMLAGSVQAVNIYASKVCGTSLTAGAALSLLGTGTFWAVTVAMLRAAVKRAERRGEGFLPSGAGIQARTVDAGLPEEQLPGLLASLLPLAALLALCIGLNWDVVPALAAACTLTVAACRRNLIPVLKNSLIAGATAAYGPILNVSVTYGIGIVIKSLEGFSYFEALLSRLPALTQGAGLGLLAAFIMASATAPVPAFGPQILESYLGAGLSVETAHRLMTFTTFSSIAPHNAGIPNAVSALCLPYADCLRMYALFSYIPGTAALAVSYAAILLGLVH